jgi:hypothetical protein
MNTSTGITAEKSVVNIRTPHLIDPAHRHPAQEIRVDRMALRRWPGGSTGSIGPTPARHMVDGGSPEDGPARPASVSPQRRGSTFFQPV